MKISRRRCWRSMESRKLNEKGFGAYEFLTMALITLVLAVIVLQIALRSQESERYSVFAYNAKVLGTNAVQIQMQLFDEEQYVIYLSDMIEGGFLTSIKNPFDGTQYCDTTESKVVFLENDKRIYLRCGNYVIQNQVLGESKVDIYEVSDWKEKRSSQKDVEKKFYNYQVNGKDVFEDDLEDTLFLKKFNQKNGTSFISIEEVKKQYKVVEKTLFRSEKLIKTVQN